jgi:hypothetical protein
LLAPDVELIRAVAAANPRTVVVIQAGSAVISSEWDATVPAVVQAWYGGSEAGSGLADVLFGRVNPSARLPFSVPVDESHLPLFERDADEFSYDRWHGWWHLARSERQPAFPFGFGLSYTTFALSDARVVMDGEQVRVRCSVTNKGDRDGADVVQVYAQLPDPTVPERLVGFERVHVAAGGTAEVEITVPFRTLATRNDKSHTWNGAAGKHAFSVGHFAGNHDGGTFIVDVPS